MTGFMKITNISPGHRRVAESEPLDFKVMVTEGGKPWAGKVAGFSRYRPSRQELWDGIEFTPGWEGPFGATVSGADGTATVVFPGQDPADGTFEIKIGAMV